MNWLLVIEYTIYGILAAAILSLTIVMAAFIIVLHEDLNLRRMKYAECNPRYEATYEITDEDDGWKTLKETLSVK